MTSRPIHWRDLPILHRFRNRSVFLDTALVLTRGPLLVPGALVSYVMPSMGITTYTCCGRDDSKGVVFGQFIHLKDAPFAQLTFLSPNNALASPNLSILLDALMVEAGNQGAFRLLAHVDEKNQAFEALRRSSFAVYTRQRIWRFSGASLESPGKNDEQESLLSDQLSDVTEGSSGLESGPSVDTAQPIFWRTARSRDNHSIRTLYNNVVPGLVQQVEPFLMSGSPKGLVYIQDDEILAYVNLIYGSRGIWVQPFVHPSAQELTQQFLSLIHHLPNRRSRPVYVCVRSYQSWLESALEALGARPGPRQAVMVKHLAVVQKVTQQVTLPVLEAGHPEITASITRVDQINQRDIIYGTEKNN